MQAPSLHVFCMALAATVFLGGCPEPRSSDGPAPNPPAVPPVRVIRVTADQDGFHPADIDVAAGEPVVLEFVRTAEDTCTDEVVFDESGLHYPLPLGKPVRVSLAVPEGRAIAFACRVDMFHGAVRTPGAAASPASESPLVPKKGDTAIEGGDLAKDGTPDGDTVEVRITRAGFTPKTVRIPAGKATVLRFTREVERTCVTGVLIPELEIDRELPVGESVEITVNPAQPGTIEFLCPMRMLKGAIEVVREE